MTRLLSPPPHVETSADLMSPAVHLSPARSFQLNPPDEWQVAGPDITRLNEEDDYCEERTRTHDI